MSARTSGDTCLTFVARGDLSDVATVVDAIEAVSARCPAATMQITYSPAPKGTLPKTHVWSTARATSVFSDASQYHVNISPRGVWRVAKPGHGTVLDHAKDGVETHLSVRNAPGAAEYDRRWSGLIMPGADGRQAAIDFLRSMNRALGIIGGGIAAHATRDDAEREAYDGGNYEHCTPALLDRLWWDVGKWRRTRTKLRRLYPVTIIGPEIWTTLPPMPAFDPMPTVEDLGTCKLVTAWPTLCDPRDPAFLRGTRDLRAWLWPYTIQNPADHVDNDPKD